MKQIFADPPREYATAPLWVWNDLLSEQQIRDTMRDMAEQKVRQVFVHPRPGLMTPYLSEDWFRLWKVALDEAAKLDMNVWIYDENSYPSGFAGGWVPELMPESRGRGLHLRETKQAPPWADNLAAVIRLEGGQSINVTPLVKAGETLPEGRYVVAEARRAANSPWHGNRCYVDLLYPGVTEKFIEVTLEAYRREIGEHFGKRVPGAFTDEPQLRPAGGFPWTDDVPEQFQKRWGYSLLDQVASLAWEVGDWKQVRHHYYQTILDLFIERWAKPYYDWCEKYDLDFTGHYWEHEWPNCVGVPDNMAMSAWQQRPGIDCLMNQYAENNHAQFGNVRACREISSLANQLGRRRTLVELYGAGGWDLRFEDMKRIGDWLQVLGVNTMNEHLSYITLRGARKRDHPQSFSYHEPWWKAYHVQASYLTRLSAALTQGQQINRILVLEPTTTLWMYQGNGGKLNEVGNAFFNLLMALESAQIEYDLGCEDVMARQGSVDGKELRVGQRQYHTLVLPPHTENLNRQTWKLARDFSINGGRVLNCGVRTPMRKDGALNADDDAIVSLNTTWQSVAPDAVPSALDAVQSQSGFRIVRAENDAGILFHHRRQLEDGQLLLLVNTSIDAPSVGRIESNLKGVEFWDLNTGKTELYAFETAGQGVQAQFSLPPSGSLLLFLSDQPIRPKPTTIEISLTPPARGSMSIQRLEPNVLTLDYVDVKAGGETRRDIYFYEANQFVWQKNGMDRNPWDSAVQFKDELISRAFPANSGFEASYKFAIEGAVPTNLAIVIERPDLYTITCNGKSIAAAEGDWWLDKAFGKIKLAGIAREGENLVTLKATPFTIYHELESAYVLGDFNLKSSQRGFVIVPAQPLRLKPPPEEPGKTHGINPDDTMWLSGGIGTGGADDREPFVVFDLRTATDLTGIQIWNYNENHVRNLTSRSADKVRITAATAGQPSQFNVDLGTFRLSRPSGSPSLPEVLKVVAQEVRFVRFDILSNHYGVQYPASGTPEDNGYVGLAEVQFVAANDQPVERVKIKQYSSELAAHRRAAARLVDRSGFGTNTGFGWNRQGHPFYAQGVAYDQHFEVADRDGQFKLQLGDWYGSVAEVKVNGKTAGYVAAPPWECDVTEQIQEGDNNIEVVVIGTLKNTLGPHHNGPGLGSAWPGMFHRGPHPGPPPGNSYHTVGYGLFEPFILKRLINQ